MTHAIDLHVTATFSDGLRFTPIGRPSAREILAEVAARHGLSPADLAGPSRRDPVALARHEAFYEVRTRTKLSLPQIGRLFGGRDHTTIGYGIGQHCRRNGLPSPLGGEWKAGRRRRAAA